jgi:hypothetical protein
MDDESKADSHRVVCAAARMDLDKVVLVRHISLHVSLCEGTPDGNRVVARRVLRVGAVEVKRDPLMRRYCHPPAVEILH